MATDDERRKAAAKLRELHPRDKSWWGISGFDWEWFADELFEAVGYDTSGHNEWTDRLADLIDPTCEAHRDVVFYPATDLTPEHEETVFRCGECEEIVSFDERYDPETDLPAYCERCGSRITGIGEPWDE